MGMIMTCDGCFENIAIGSVDDISKTMVDHSLVCPYLIRKRAKEKEVGQMSKLQQFFATMFNVIRKPFDVVLTWTETKLWTLIFLVDKTLDRMRNSTNRFVERMSNKIRR